MGSSTTRGTAQHYLPAAYIGRFSAQADGRPRDRRVFVADDRAPRVFTRSAAAVAKVIGLYDYVGPSLGSSTADDAWGFESGLPQALEALEDPTRELGGVEWLDNLVPFVASLFARGPDFHERYMKYVGHISRAMGQDLATARDQSTMARVTLIQDLLPAVMASVWRVLHFPMGVELLTNDRGYLLSVQPDLRTVHYIVPLSKRSALSVEPSARRCILKWNGQSWASPVEHVEVAPRSAERINRSIVAFALHAAFGPTKAAMSRLRSEVATAPYVGHVGFPSIDAMCHRYDYFRAVTAARRPYDQRSSLCFDWTVVAGSKWSAPIVVELVHVDETSGGLSQNDRAITLDLSYGIAHRAQRQSPAIGAFTLVGLGDRSLRRHTDQRCAAARRARPAPSSRTNGPRRGRSRRL